MFDLTGYIADRAPARRHRPISRTWRLCPYAEPERFFSYRRMTRLGEPDYGRHINAIAIAD